MATIIKTLKLKVQPNSYAYLNEAKNEVNHVWNYCNETQIKGLETGVERPKRKYFSGYDLCNLTAGTSQFMEYIGAQTIQRVCIEYATKRKKARKSRLKWRSYKRSLGWVPFNAGNIKREGKYLRYQGKTIRIFDYQRLYGVKWKQGCFTQDACGEWWVCLPVEVECTDNPAPKEIVGVDLGLKNTLVTSDGFKADPSRFYRELEPKLGNSQRMGHKKQAKFIHRKIKNRRRDFLHKVSKKLVNEYQTIVVGDVSSSKLAKTKMAKSVYDAGWGMLRAFLLYKGQQTGRKVLVINERNTSRACSNCGALSGPQGVNGLGVREWVCVDCGAVHDRDVNAAKNILTLGSRLLTPVSGNEQLLAA